MRLKELGHELVKNRNEAAHLRDGIYELRVKRQNVNYRMLYFFNGKGVAVLSHGLTKEREVPIRDIELAIKRKNSFASNPDGYSAALGEE